MNLRDPVTQGQFNVAMHHQACCPPRCQSLQQTFHLPLFHSRLAQVQPLQTSLQQALQVFDLPGKNGRLRDHR